MNKNKNLLYEIEYEKELKTLINQKKLEKLKSTLFDEIIEYNEIKERLKLMTKYNQKIILKEKIKKIKIKIELKIEIIKKLNQNLNLINKENLKEY